MEELKEVMDEETLKKSYLFPATPYDDDYLMRRLSYPFDCELPQGTEDDLCDYVDYALAVSRSKKSEGHPKVHLNKELVTHLLFTQPCYRLDGRKVDAETVLEGKYIMACSLPVPDSWDSCVRDLAIKSNELYAQRPLDFEMIIVATLLLDDDWKKYANIDRHFKTFHPSCIVIPLHPELEESLNLHALNTHDALVIHPNNEVLVNLRLSTLTDYGSAAFPFTDEVSSLWKEYLHRKPSSLEDFFGLGPSFEVFRKIPDTEPLRLEYRSVSHFKSKIVLLYLYKVGDKLPFLYNTLIGLRDKGMEFEIVTAYVPYPVEYYDPLQFPFVFSTAVAQCGLSLWVAPFESSMYPRLCSLYSCACDQLIVFDPKLNEGDPHGFQIMAEYGGKLSVFPFTKTNIAEHIMKELSQVTLQSFFSPITDLYMEGDFYQNSKNKSLLNGKNVLVYFDSCPPDHRTVFDPFNSWCKSLEAENRDFELVFVCLNPDDEIHGTMFEDLKLPFPRWLVRPPDESAHSKYVVHNFFLKLFKHEFTTVVAFGKDGKICSMRAHSVVSSCCKAGTFPFDDCDLPGEVYKILDDYFSKLLDDEG